MYAGQLPNSPRRDWADRYSHFGSAAPPQPPPSHPIASQKDVPPHLAFPRETPNHPSHQTHPRHPPATPFPPPGFGSAHFGGDRDRAPPPPARSFQQRPGLSQPPQGHQFPSTYPREPHPFARGPEYPSLAHQAPSWPAPSRFPHEPQSSWQSGGDAGTEPRPSGEPARTPPARPQLGRRLSATAPLFVSRAPRPAAWEVQKDDAMRGAQRQAAPHPETQAGGGDRGGGGQERSGEVGGVGERPPVVGRLFAYHQTPPPPLPTQTPSAPLHAIQSWQDPDPDLYQSGHTSTELRVQPNNTPALKVIQAGGGGGPLPVPPATQPRPPRMDQLGPRFPPPSLGAGARPLPHQPQPSSSTMTPSFHSGQQSGQPPSGQPPSGQPPAFYQQPQTYTGQTQQRPPPAPFIASTRPPFSHPYDPSENETFELNPPHPHSLLPRYLHLQSEGFHGRAVFRVHSSRSASKIWWTGDHATSGFFAPAPVFAHVTPSSFKSSFGELIRGGGDQWARGVYMRSMMVDHILCSAPAALRNPRPPDGGFWRPPPGSFMDEANGMEPEPSMWISTTRSLDWAIFEIARILALDQAQTNAGSVGPVPGTESKISTVRLAMIKHAARANREADGRIVVISDEARVVAWHYLNEMARFTISPNRPARVMEAMKLTAHSQETLYWGRIFSENILEDLVWTNKEIPFNLPAKFWRPEYMVSRETDGSWLGRLRWNPLVDTWDTAQSMMKAMFQPSTAWEQQPVHQSSSAWPPKPQLAPPKKIVVVEDPITKKVMELEKEKAKAAKEAKEVKEGKGAKEGKEMKRGEKNNKGEEVAEKAGADTERPKKSGVKKKSGTKLTIKVPKLPASQKVTLDLLS
ncbi:hypothetical protein IAT38_003871 [Cryptococcus sp. DSM 104549]